MTIRRLSKLLRAALVMRGGRRPRRSCPAPLASAARAGTRATTASARDIRRDSAAAQKSGTILAQTPLMGWSSWSLESTNYPGVNPTGGASWLTEAHILQQADALSGKLKAYGYDYVNINAGWSNGFDQYGRPIANPTTFPDGIAYIANRVHAEGLKLGIYLAVGLAPAAYDDGNDPDLRRARLHHRRHRLP